jgi:hypothetical protein
MNATFKYTHLALKIAYLITTNRATLVQTSCRKLKSKVIVIVGEPDELGAFPKRATIVLVRRSVAV